jgi:hypothetical protein
LGYLNVSAVQTFVLGTPASLETQFMIEGAMDKILPGAIPLLDRILTNLEIIEQQSVDDLELLAVNRVGDIEVSDKEHSRLLKQYDRWVGALCNLLGIQRNVFDKRGQGSSLNARVVR